MHTHTQRVIRIVTSLVMGLGVLIHVALSPAIANVIVTATPNYQSPVKVGIPYTASITITNASTGTEFSLPIFVFTIFHTPSCGSNIDPACALPDQGVFTISNPVADPGTACAANSFSIGPTDPSGELEIISNSAVVLGPASAGGAAATCIIDFTVTVLKLPSIDVDVATGIQTYALAHVVGHKASAVNANGRESRCGS